MKDRPRGVRDGDLIFALATAWGVAVQSVKYLPLGAGSYHWVVVDRGGQARIVTVDDLGAGDVDAGDVDAGDVGAGDRCREVAFAALGRALDTALALHRDAGLDFVVAPIPTRTGSTVYRLDARWAVSVFPMVEGQAGEFGAHRPEDRPELVGLLVELHGATPVVAAGAPRADLTLPGRAGFEGALRGLDRGWTGGPFSEPARKLLATHAAHLARLLGDFDRLVEQVRPTDTAWVVTHGEPHPGNLIRTGSGLRLIDWETVQIAPPERDLWLVAGDSDDALASYTRATGRPLSPAGLALYPLWWKLADIALFVDELRRPHQDTEDTTASWGYLRSYFD